MLLGAVLVLLLLGGAGPASAHAALRGTDPEDGTVLKSAPRLLTLTFTESVGLLDDSVRILRPDGRRLSVDDARHAPEGDATARVTLPRGLEQGTYTVAWRVVSADSHPVSGAFTFSVGKPSPAPAAPDLRTEDPATAALHKIARYLAYLGAALLIGTAAFVALCRPPDTTALRTLLLAGWWTLFVTTLALLVLRAPYETGEGPAAALDPSSLTRTLATRPGLALLARLALLLGAAAYLVRQHRAAADPVRQHRPHRDLVGAALAIGLALTWAAAEHASAGIQVPVAMTSSVLHLLATTVWLGGLTALLVLLFRSPVPLPGHTVVRFSRLAFASVTVLVVTGVYQSWRGLGSWNALTDTTYGRLLVLKLAAVALLLAAAGLSRRWTARAAGLRPAAAREKTRIPALAGAQRPAAPDDPSPAPEGPSPAPEQPLPPPPDARVLRRSVLAEVVVGVAVLVITTVLTGTLPGRAEAEAAQQPQPTSGTSVTTVPFDVGTPGGTGKVQITLDPGRIGENSVQAVVYGADGGFSTVPELRVSFTLPSEDIGPLDANLTDRGGYWATSDVNLPLPGTWTMKVTVRVSEVDQVSESVSVQVR
ncbi:copper resistance CopC/CopD family protein [Streptomyces sp. TRM68416]|uniref:copper resistance CopC/CopD family protein n=1 Tax=Streptomyces sp. TRM68416 TaxID=2758412 RepID=UPI001661C0A3|nr:copper resistance protein CopC [Streptomyces sp. TRM68416]MBD0838608.1 copper resistance protein CopC/CopD [Streptomyces sp. TRM68416]